MSTAALDVMQCRSEVIKVQNAMYAIFAGDVVVLNPGIA